MPEPLDWTKVAERLELLARTIRQHKPIAPLRHHFMRTFDERIMFIIGPNGNGYYRGVDINDGCAVDFYANGQCFCSNHESIISATVTGEHPPCYLIEDLGAQL